MSDSIPVDRFQLALDTIACRPTTGIPTWLLNIMDHAHLERLAGAQPGDYAAEPERVYLAAQNAIGACMIDQWIPHNPLSMKGHGYEHGAQKATEGLAQIVLDGIIIDSPEEVIEHMEMYVLPALEANIQTFDAVAFEQNFLEKHREVQTLFGNAILKVPYGSVMFPKLDYSRYGYEQYFMAYALYPELVERQFALQADLAQKVNTAIAHAYKSANLAPLYRLDHDMADSRGTLVDIRSLERIWLPHLARSIKPLVDAGIALLWHCDGNLMQLLPRLLDVGVRGFQGFQYEDGMDYQAICRMKTRDGQEPIIIAGVSVTTTIPHGSPADVKRELDFLVEHGPEQGLFLGASSSIAPGAPWDNIAALVEGLTHYRHGQPTTMERLNTTPA